MNIETLRDLYLSELQEAISVEAQLSEALPQLVDATTATDLNTAVARHLEVTRSQHQRLDALLHGHGVETRRHRDQSMQTLIAEATSWIGTINDSACRDAALVASVQRILHSEIAVFGTLKTWAMRLGLDPDGDTLSAILDEEKAADETLSGLAETVVNPAAA